jgi:predicted amidohydrolase YtcJ
MRYPVVVIIIVSAVAACAPADEPRSAGQPADSVFRGGRVYTADSERSWAESVAIRDGEIVFVGSDAGVSAFVGDDTVVHDLDGEMLMPGFHDGHAHVYYGGMSQAECDLHDGFDPDRLRSLLIECINSGDYGTDDWVSGGGWSLAAFPDGNAPREMLDEVLDGRPAFFGDAFGHNAWVSSRALEIAGIDADTPDPPQGVIVRDPATGEPSGTLRDNAMYLVRVHIPAASDEERYAGLMAGLRQANSFGITAYIEPGVDKSILETYRDADRSGDLSARVVASLSPIAARSGRFGPEVFELLAARDKYRGRNLNVDSVKVYIDGVLETETSFMLQPYLDGKNFPPFYEQDELDELFRTLDGTGLQIHTHAIGDAAIRAALDAYEYARDANGPNDNRHQIVHLQLIDDEDIPRFAELGVAADFQCMWCYPDIYIDYAVDVVGADRVQRFYPVRRVAETGALVVGGSDWDVSSLNPLDAIETAITRRDPFENDGPVLGVNEEIDLATALDMYTRNAAYVMRLEERTGSLEVGKRADMIVLDRNLFEIPPGEINEARVVMTMLDGNIVYTNVGGQD